MKVKTQVADVTPSAVEARMTFRSLLVPVFKDKWRLLAVLTAVLGLTILVAASMTPRYTAEAKLYAKLGREYTYRAQAGDAELVGESFDRGQAIRAEVEILRAQDLADATIA